MASNVDTYTTVENKIAIIALDGEGAIAVDPKDVPKLVLDLIRLASELERES